MIESTYFKESEFNKCNPVCSLQDMNQEFIEMLDQARQYAGIPFVINSAFRPVDWEKNQGREGSSAHTLGMAVDIRCNSSSNRFKIIDALLFVGFNRIGIANNFIHVDCSNIHAQKVIWTY